jgi:hypothetical protein
MTSYEFVIWLRGFTEACPEFHPTPKQWDKLKEVLNEVQDYDDNPGLDFEVDSYYPRWTTPLTGSRTISVSGSGTDFFTSPNGNSSYTRAVWNDQRCCWTANNSPEGFGYYTNSTADIKKEQQLND